MAARWACGVAGAVAAVSAFLPWARANLADRGADLLVVTRSGLDYRAIGWATVGVASAVVAVCVATAWWPRLRVLVVGLPPCGVALSVLALSRLGADEPLARKLSTLRIGTFQTDAPVTGSAVGVGLWLCLAAGLVVVAGGLAWVVLDRRRRGTPARPFGAPGPARAGEVPPDRPSDS